MIHFEWPWLFFILPLPLLLRLMLPRADEAREAALRVPALEQFAMERSSNPARLKLGRRRAWIGALAWLLLVTAAARPVWIGNPIDLPVSGRDLMLAVDLSGSMQTPDFVINGHQVSRLDAIKAIAGDFIDRRVGDRIGLILFGTQAYLQTPLTFDRQTVHDLLDESAIGLAGEQTAIGDAIGLAVKRLREVPAGNKVLILLTDGVSNTGELTPLKAAQLAAKEGVTIYTIGIGASEMQVPSMSGMQSVNPSSDLDEDTLRAIAKETGGRYFRARDTEQLNQIYSILDKLQPLDQEKQTFRPHNTLFYWPLAVSLLLSMLLLMPLARRK
jgi:Ca-activated chloride channel family protein